MIFHIRIPRLILFWKGPQYYPFKVRKKGESIVVDLFREMADEFIHKWDLINLKRKNISYSWSNMRLGPGHVATRLDKFLIHSSLLLFGHLLSSRIISYSVSNHIPIYLLVYVEPHHIHISFRFHLS